VDPTAPIEFGFNLDKTSQLVTNDSDNRDHVFINGLHYLNCDIECKIWEGDRPVKGTKYIPAKDGKLIHSQSFNFNIQDSGNRKGTKAHASVKAKLKHDTKYTVELACDRGLIFTFRTTKAPTSSSVSSAISSTSSSASSSGSTSSSSSLILSSDKVNEAKMTSSQIRMHKYVKGTGQEEYLSVLDREKMDFDALTLATKDDLERIGIPLGPRLKILAGLVPASAANPVSVPSRFSRHRNKSAGSGSGAGGSTGAPGGPVDEIHDD